MKGQRKYQLTDSNDPATQRHGNRWYVTTIVFCSFIAEVASLRPLCEERIVLFYASSVDEATVAAVKHGQSEEHSYINPQGELVTWSFMRVESVEAVPQDPANGAWEITSRYVRRSRKSLSKE